MEISSITISNSG
jgi:WD40 repeat protein